jgi:hypothetical protein
MIGYGWLSPCYIHNIYIYIHIPCHYIWLVKNSYVPLVQYIRAHPYISLFTVITRSEVVGVMAHPTASSPATVGPVHCIYHMFILYPYFMIYDYIGFMIYYIISTWLYSYHIISIHAHDMHILVAYSILKPIYFPIGSGHPVQVACFCSSPPPGPTSWVAGE